MIDYPKLIAGKISLPDIDVETLKNDIVLTQDAGKGDFSLPCFRFSKMLKKSPQQIAQTLASSIALDEYIEKVEAVNGYLNIFVNKQKAVSDTVTEICQLGCQFGKSNIGAGKTICIDYSSVNIAKSLHIGHLGTTAIGNSLYKLFAELGFKVVGINHLGDYGTQFGKMIVAFKLWGDDYRMEQEGARFLQEIYTKFHEQAETHPELEVQAREWFSRIEKGDSEALRLFEIMKKITLDDVCETYKKLNVNFDSWDGESFFNDKMEKPLEYLQQKGLVTISDGAKIVDLSDFNMPPCLLVKSDGSSLYATRDIAAAFFRKEKYNFDKCLYVVAYQQDLHFKQLFKVLELAGLPWAKDMVHVSYGMVSLEEGAMSTRKGNTIFLEDIIKLAVSKALQIIQEKNPNLADKEKVASQVGIGAVVFSALENARIKDITFTFDRVLSFEGETSPYLQYTHARCCSLFEKAGQKLENFKDVEIDTSMYDNDECLAVAKLLKRFPDIVLDSATKYEPSILSKYLIDLAQAFNKFYFEHRILMQDTAQQNANLLIVRATQIVLKKGLALLGIEAPTQM